MLKSALGLALAAFVAQAVPAQARIEVIYPPYAYDAGHEVCPPFWSDAEIDHTSPPRRDESFREVENEIFIFRGGHRATVVVYVTAD